MSNLLRTLWDSQPSTSVFKMMNRLEETQEKTYNEKSKTKIVRFRSGVTFKMSTLVEDLNTLANFVNGLQRVPCDSSLSSLLFKMTNNQNVEPIVDRLLSYLKEAPIEAGSRKDLVHKISSLGENFAPNQNWYVRNMNKLFEIGGD